MNARTYCLVIALFSLGWYAPAVEAAFARRAKIPLPKPMIGVMHGLRDWVLSNPEDRRLDSFRWMGKIDPGLDFKDHGAVAPLAAGLEITLAKKEVPKDAVKNTIARAFGGEESVQDAAIGLLEQAQEYAVVLAGVALDDEAKRALRRVRRMSLEEAWRELVYLRRLRADWRPYLSQVNQTRVEAAFEALEERIDQLDVDSKFVHRLKNIGYEYMLERGYPNAGDIAVYVDAATQREAARLKRVEKALAARPKYAEVPPAEMDPVDAWQDVTDRMIDLMPGDAREEMKRNILLGNTVSGPPDQLRWMIFLGRFEEIERHIIPWLIGQQDRVLGWLYKIPAIRDSVWFRKRNTVSSAIDRYYAVKAAHSAPVAQIKR